jgi:hypothetical protein
MQIQNPADYYYSGQTRYIREDTDKQLKKKEEVTEGKREGRGKQEGMKQQNGKHRDKCKETRKLRKKGRKLFKKEA